ncbi:uncharacterized protein LOC131144944 [Malania oleifera]|uniref:uncharacterized protein LOC131144944 n=1 Tax=Malania oleifera TaxID=397392 RepID=UPI0025AECC3D|nr:uncharacterized protein LOC131144944 [Malania oleifera]
MRGRGGAGGDLRPIESRGRLREMIVGVGGEEEELARWLVAESRVEGDQVGPGGGEGEEAGGAGMVVGGGEQREIKWEQAAGKGKKQGRNWHSGWRQRAEGDQVGAGGGEGEEAGGAGAVADGREQREIRWE